MVIQLHNLTGNPQARKKKKRRGRGNASGQGTYAGRGMKGQRSRSGGKKGLKLKGFKRTLLNLPKFNGMKSYKLKNQIIKLSQLNKKFADGDKITPEILREKQIIDKLKIPVKILFDQEAAVKVEIENCLVSASAKKSIEKAGGKVVLATEQENKKT